MTVTPEVALHCDAAARTPAATAPGAATAMIAIAAPSATTQRRRVNPFTASSTRGRDQHGVSETVTDAAVGATGRALLAIAGTACTVANTFALVVGGKKNAPYPGCAHPSW